MERFDIIEYISGLSPFVFSKAVLKRIALDREVTDVDDYSMLTQKEKDLLLADVLYAAYMSPNVWASSTNQHGSFSKTVGHQTLYEGDRDRLYNTFFSIYKRYNDERLSELDSIGGSLQWL